MFSPVSPSPSKKTKSFSQQKKSVVVNNGIKGHHEQSPPVPSKSSMDDWKALEMINGGNKNAFGFIYNKYKGYILAKIQYCLRCDRAIAEDIMMDIFEKVYKSLHSYKKDFTFNAWISAVVHNYIIDYVRMYNRRNAKTIEIDSVFSNEDNDGDMSYQLKSKSKNPEELYLAKEEMDNVINKMNQLQDDYRNFLKMRYLEQYSYEEISDKLGIPLGTVKIKIFRARNELTMLLKGERRGIFPNNKRYNNNVVNVK